MYVFRYWIIIKGIQIMRYFLEAASALITVLNGKKNERKQDAE